MTNHNNAEKKTLFTRNPYTCRNLTTLQDWVFLLQESRPKEAGLAQNENQLRESMQEQISLLKEKIERLERQIESEKYAQGVLA